MADFHSPPLSEEWAWLLFPVIPEMEQIFERKGFTESFIKCPRVTLTVDSVIFQAFMSLSQQSRPPEPKKAAHEVIEKYGEPTGVTADRLIWSEPQEPFPEIIVYKETLDHQFPKPHQDYLEHAVRYAVPEDKIDDLTQFDGSVIVYRTDGDLPARCHKEAANTATLNLPTESSLGKWRQTKPAKPSQIAVRESEGVADPKSTNREVRNDTTKSIQHVGNGGKSGGSHRLSENQHGPVCEA